MTRRRRGLRWSATAVFLTIIARSSAIADDPAVRKLRGELEKMKRQMHELQMKMEQQQQTIDELTRGRATAPAPAPAPSTAAKEDLKREVTEEVTRALQPELSAANKVFPSQFNPAIGFTIDTVGSYTRQDQANFEFRSAELGISASIDPFARGYGIINGTPDGVDVEEAWMQTTSLPYNLTVKGGRFFADFGRLSTFHDHDLPFVNRPTPLEDYVGGESQADGVETSWLVPLTSQYLNLTGGWYNKMGADNERVSNDKPRELSQFTYLGRADTYFNLADAHGLDLGFSDAYTPRVVVDDNRYRNLLDVDLTYRYTPLREASYRGLTWGSEFLLNSENRQQNADQTDSNPEIPPAFSWVNAFGMYSYLEAKLTRVLRPGFMFEYTQDLNGVEGPAEGYTPYLTIWPSEFQRFRLQYTHLSQPGGDDDQFFLQWTAVLGSHVHGFRDR